MTWTFLSSRRSRPEGSFRSVAPPAFLVDSGRDDHDSRACKRGIIAGNDVHRRAERDTVAEIERNGLAHGGCAVDENELVRRAALHRRQRCRASDRSDADDAGFHEVTSFDFGQGRGPGAFAGDISRL